MGTTRWLDDEEKRAWKGFLAVSTLVGRRVEQQLKNDAGLSHAQYEILVRLADAPGGSLRMTELADALLTPKSGVTYQVAQLEKAGLVERRSCPTDVRGIFAVLTEEGRAKLADTAPGHVEAVRQALFDPLTPAQVHALAEAFDALRDPAAGPGPCPAADHRPDAAAE